MQDEFYTPHRRGFRDGRGERFSPYPQGEPYFQAEMRPRVLLCSPQEQYFDTRGSLWTDTYEHWPTRTFSSPPDEAYFTPPAYHPWPVPDRNFGRRRPPPRHGRTPRRPPAQVTARVLIESDRASSSPGAFCTLSFSFYPLSLLPDVGPFGYWRGHSFIVVSWLQPCVVK